MNWTCEHCGRFRKIETKMTLTLIIKNHTAENFSLNNNGKGIGKFYISRIYWKQSDRRKQRITYLSLCRCLAEHYLEEIAKRQTLVKAKKKEKILTNFLKENGTWNKKKNQLLMKDPQDFIHDMLGENYYVL